MAAGRPAGPSLCQALHQTIWHVGEDGKRRASGALASGAKRIQSMAAVSLGSRLPTRPWGRVDRRPACVRTRLTVERRCRPVVSRRRAQLRRPPVHGDRDRLAWKFDCLVRELCGVPGSPGGHLYARGASN
jgi:hypothetical protein